MDYRHIIKRARQITWQYKFLWAFGIIMTLCGQGSELKIRIRVPMPFFALAGDYSNFPAYFPEPLGQTHIGIYIVALSLLMMIFGGIGIIVGAVSRTILINSIDKVENGESINFSTSWPDWLEKARPVALLLAVLDTPLLIIKTLITITSFIWVWVLFILFISFETNIEGLDQSSFLNGMFPTFVESRNIMVGVGCLFVTLQIITALFRTFGSRAIVLENQGLISSFSRSWYIFSKNIRSTLVLIVMIFLIFMVIGFIVTIIIAIPVLGPLSPTIMKLISPETSLSSDDYLLIGGVGVIVFIIFSFIHGIIQVFIETVWTLAYREFMSKIS